MTAVASPQDPKVLPPPRDREERPAGVPKAKKKFKARSLSVAGATPAGPGFKAPPKSEWKDAPGQRKGAGAPTTSASSASRPPPLASEKYGSNLAGGGVSDWVKLTAALPTGRTAEAKEERKRLFGKFDFNGNGYL